MDALTYIIALMVAIVFGWIGYFLGNFFPVFGKAKKIKEANRATGRSMVDLNPVKDRAKKAINWLMEKEAPSSEEPASPDDEEQADAPAAPAAQAPAKPESPSVNYVVSHPEQVGDEALVLWHDRKKKKMVAKLENDFIDLDHNLSSKQHGALSILLIDLQEKVGLSAALRRAITDETDKVFADKERQQLVPSKEELQSPSFNPLKSFVNYVKADIPKIDDKPESIPEQINEILQQLIKNTPLENKGISVADWPNRGVVFIVGIDIFEDIHKIPDSEIRLAIRSAVKQWEKSQAEESR